MLYDGDIKLDVHGNTVVKNGDIDVTTSDYEFIMRSLLLMPGAFRSSTGIGIGLETYMGEALNSELIDELTNDIYFYFKRFNIYITLKIFVIDRHTLAVNITVPDQNIEIITSIDLDAGKATIMEYENIDASVETTSKPTTKTNNIYLDRRSI